MLRKKHHSTRGQALVEFALIIVVLLMIVFFIIEASRILWGWVTVQNAAREGARYASTGRFEGPDCVTDDLPKFTDRCDDLRVASIIDVTHEGLSGLPLDEQSGIFEDDNYYNIEVWGVDQYGQIQPDFAGIPQQPVIVRAYYRVPIITPFFRPILPSIPVFGQVIINNESFGQLGNANQGQGLPPPVPPIPTAGVTPSPTPSPTPTNTPTRGASPTPTATATGTGTPPSECPIRFVGSAVAGNRSVLVNGVVDTTATIVNLTTGETLGADTLLDRPSENRVCDGLGDFNPPQLSQPLVAGHVLLAQSSDGSFDTTIVLAEPPTSTPTPTNTQVPTVAVTNTPTPTPTNTPSTPYIRLLPSCGSGPDIQFNVLGYNWPTTESISLFWDTNQLESIISAGHPGFFQQTWAKSGITDGTYQVRAVSASHTYSTSFTVPCDDATPMPATAEPSPTPAPADLIVVGPPRLISTRPIIAYQPVQFGVTISNTGDIDVNSQFFVDLYFDPTVVISTGIPISQSVGYMAVSSLAGGASRAITITAPLGFKNEPQDHLAYGMVDSIKQVFEDDETNNVSTPFGIDYVTPAATPTPTATPNQNGVDTISGVVRSRDIDWLPQFRAVVKLVNELTLQVVATTLTDQNGFYQFTNVPSGNYTVSACITIDNTTVSGLRTGITPPNPYVDVFMLPGPCP